MIACDIRKIVIKSVSVVISTLLIRGSREDHEWGSALQDSDVANAPTIGDSAQQARARMESRQVVGKPAKSGWEHPRLMGDSTAADS